MAKAKTVKKKRAKKKPSQKPERTVLGGSQQKIFVNGGPGVIFLNPPGPTLFTKWLGEYTKAQSAKDEVAEVACTAEVFDKVFSHTLELDVLDAKGKPVELTKDTLHLLSANDKHVSFITAFNARPSFSVDKVKNI